MHELQQIMVRLSSIVGRGTGAGGGGGGSSSSVVPFEQGARMFSTSGVQYFLGAGAAVFVDALRKLNLLI
jgi:hypothetical protein